MCIETIIFTDCILTPFFSTPPWIILEFFSLAIVELLQCFTESLKLEGDSSNHEFNSTIQYRKTNWIPKKSLSSFCLNTCTKRKLSSSSIIDPMLKLFLSLVFFPWHLTRICFPTTQDHYSSFKTDRSFHLLCGTPLGTWKCYHIPLNCLFSPKLNLP